MPPRKYYRVVKLLLLGQLLAACSTTPTTVNTTVDTPRVTSNSTLGERDTATAQGDVIQASESVIAPSSATPALEPCVPPLLPPMASGMITANVYFTCPDIAPDFPVQPVPRYITSTLTAEEQIRAVVSKLLAGPTSGEKSVGFVSWFSEATAGKLNSVTITDSETVIIDFAKFSSIIPNASTSAGTKLLLSQLDSTVFQFPNIQAVVYQFDGSCDAFYAWLQSTCQTRTRADWEMRQRTPTN